MNRTVSLPFLVMGVVFCVCLICSNLLEVKMVSLGGITATAGLIVFPISYIINDCIAEVWGYRKARLIIWLGFLMNLLAVLFIQLAIVLPSTPFWEGQSAFEATFSSTPRILLASFIAFLAGSFLNAYVMSKMKISSGGKHFSLRAIASTIVGESADSLLFFPIAFGGVVPVKELIVLIVTQACLKTAYEIIILPVTIRVVRLVKRIDGSDVYDRQVSYNIFKIKEIQ
ncbi:queuosine precursor transporter [Barnesiella viscericola]|uniref:Probable queuosine precursor transporter n=1 Tax=Barnesiella viscericola TaxID=397865 RepID=A0A921MSL7_9BACT|nr:queuosine precursor transporter [Barnesiella viscericola]HJG89667.1 queuosine precursor transporter [Barnesiella viscericola]